MMDHLQACAIVLRTFPGIRGSEADDLIRSGAIQTYKGGAILCHENAMETVFYILLDGRVQVTKWINNMESKLLKVLQPGDFFGEMALIHNAPRAATVSALTPLIVLEISKEAFNRLIQRNSSVSLAIVREVSRRLRENDAMAIEDLRIKARELANAYQLMAEQSYFRTEFLTTVAQELRTPLTTASGYLQIARRGMLEGEALNQTLDAISRNFDEIIRLVNDILFVQEMDLIVPEFRPTDVGLVIASAVEQYHNQAQDCGIRLIIKIAPDLPVILADANSLQRSFAAILDNAIKFSPEGGEVCIEAVPAQDELLIRFSDRGVGIPAEALPHIFERFFHLDEVGGYLFRGMGLGLAIARQVIEQHGGTIAAESAPGKGSVFTIRLNVA